MNDIATRIAGLVNESGLSLRTLSKAIGVNHVSLSQWVTGKNRPSDKGLEALCLYFHVSPAWVLYGDDSAAGAQSIRLEDAISIPLLEAEGACGAREDLSQYGCGIITMVRVTYEFIRNYCPSASMNSLHIITAKGDSMMPTLNNGGAVIVDVSQRDVTQDGLYAVELGGSTLIKRIQITHKGLLLLSDNTKYKPFTIDDGDTLNVIGRVYVGLQIRRLL